MKTKFNLKASLVLIAISSISISSLASGDINISTMEESVKAKVEIEVPTRANVNVSIMDPNGIVIHSDLISKDANYGKVFDFSQVDDGEYTFVTKTGPITVTKTIELENNTISVINKEYAYKPIFKIEDELLIVNFLNESNEDISLSIEDSSKDYFKEEGDNSLSYGKLINIKNLPVGEYNLILAVGEKEYNYRFRR